MFGTLQQDPNHISGMLFIVITKSYGISHSVCMFSAEKEKESASALDLLGEKIHRAHMPSSAPTPAY